MDEVCESMAIPVGGEMDGLMDLMILRGYFGRYWMNRCMCGTEDGSMDVMGLAGGESGRGLVYIG